MPTWVSKYVGIPYVRDGLGLGCWRLLRLVYLNELGINLPTYGEISQEELLKMVRVFAAEVKKADPWVEVKQEERQNFDACLMKLSGHWHHIGVCAFGRVLHVENEAGAVFVPLNHHLIVHRSKRFFRHKRLFQCQ
jgi:hypothetical protein